jgi:AcrR family transcriptional regulator
LWLKIIRMAKKVKPEAEASTEEKIKEAARTVFMKKGYAATRTRDIAEEAGINLALLNYYFRSKEKLFELVMMEKFQKFFGVIFPILNDTARSLEQKIEMIAENYITMLTENQDLPIFILSEIRNNPERFVSNVQLSKVLAESHFVKQLHAKRPDMNPVQLVMSILGLVVFPFLMRPLLVTAKNTDQKGFHAMMQERKAWIPKWANAILKTT